MTKNRESFFVYYESFDPEINVPERRRFHYDRCYKSKEDAQKRVAELKAQEDVNWARIADSYESMQSAHFLWTSR